ncbi:SGNH/GDSL hydrolase family protein [Geodermatophilus sp. SYSU D01119]
MIRPMVSGQRAAQTRFVIPFTLLVVLIGLLPATARATDGIGLAAWSVTVASDKSVSFSITTSGGGGLAPRLGAQSIVGYTCVEAATGAEAYGTAASFGAEWLVSGNTYQVGPLVQQQVFPTVNCETNALYLSGSDNSTVRFETPEALRQAGIEPLQFTIPGEDDSSSPPLNPTPPAFNQGEYVAMGDSYSSGEGIPPFIGPSASNGCHRSASAYSQQFAQASDWAGDVRFVACSGATVASVQSGQNGEASQLNGLSESTTLVSLTLGGNDIGFASIAKTCVATGNCQRGYDRLMSDRIDSMASRLAGLYDEILAQAPNAELFVLGYPRLFPANPGANCNGIQRREAVWLNGLVDSINDSMQGIVDITNASADRERVHYVETGDAFIGGELCATSAPVYVNGVIRRNLVYSFHPTAQGQAMLAARLENAVNAAGLLD